ncbi:MAG: hypothetical protein H8D23_19315 [Candidatus Brocadiales bacterium]|nr:hypothetical protein [Candidatus Brocadiales bacterium]
MKREEFNAEVQRKTEVRKIDRYLPEMLMLAFSVNGQLFSHFGNAAFLAKWLAIWSFCQPWHFDQMLSNVSPESLNSFIRVMSSAFFVRGSSVCIRG